MRYFDLKNIGKASTIALGTATFGTAVDRETSFNLMDCFFENGGNIIDTAHVYANWLSDEKSVSEKTIGEWMKDRKNRSSVILSTNGAHPHFENLEVSRLKRADIEEDINGSLKNLKTDYIDVYFLHRDDINLPVGEIMDTLNDIVKTGKARSIGLSNWCPERIREAINYCKENNYADISVSQIHFGIAHPNPDGIDKTTEYMTAETYNFHKETKLPLFSFSSQSGGYFFMKDENGNPIENKSHDNAKSREKFKLVYRMSEKYNCSVAQILVSALCHNADFQTFPIIGGVNKSQIIDSIKGVDIEMSQRDVKILLERA